MLSNRIFGLFVESRWLLVLGLSACLSVTTGCGGESTSSTDDPSTGDDDEADDDADDDDDSDDSASDDDADDDDDSSSGAKKDAGRDSGSAGGKKDSGAGSGTKDSGAAPSTGRDGGGQVSTKPDAGGGDAGNRPSTPPVSSGEACTPPPSMTFQTTWESGGPDGSYTVVRPTNLGEGGFMHPPIAWGNGVTTTPDLYTEFLNNIAAQGFVVIADPGITVTAQIVRQGLEWLIAQGESGGKFAGKLASDCAGTIGYSMGGGSAVGAGSHPAVKAVVSIHGLPDASGAAKGPILLTTSDNDGFVTKEGFVQPCYDLSSVQPTILATHITGLPADFGGHIEPVFTGGEDAEPSIAWLRFWIYGDQSQKDWFYGADCKLCKSPWADIQRKNHDWE